MRCHEEYSSAVESGATHLAAAKIVSKLKSQWRRRMSHSHAAIPYLLSPTSRVSNTLPVRRLATPSTYPHTRTHSPLSSTDTCCSFFLLFTVCCAAAVVVAAADAVAAFRRCHCRSRSAREAAGTSAYVIIAAILLQRTCVCVSVLTLLVSRSLLSAAVHRGDGGAAARATVRHHHVRVI